MLFHSQIWILSTNNNCPAPDTLPVKYTLYIILIVLRHLPNALRQKPPCLLLRTHNLIVYLNPGPPSRQLPVGPGSLTVLSIPQLLLILLISRLSTLLLPNLRPIDKCNLSSAAPFVAAQSRYPDTAPRRSPHGRHHYSPLRHTTHRTQGLERKQGG
jgi:hypothetical protein